MHRRVSVAALAISVSSVLVLAAGCGSATTTASTRTVARHGTLRRSAPQLARELGDDASECIPRTVYFAFDDDRLDQASRRELQRSARCLRRGEEQSIHLVGSTDTRGTEE